MKVKLRLNYKKVKLAIALKIKLSCSYKIAKVVPGAYIPIYIIPSYIIPKHLPTKPWVQTVLLHQIVTVCWEAFPTFFPVTFHFSSLLVCASTSLTWFSFCPCLYFCYQLFPFTAYLSSSVLGNALSSSNHPGWCSAFHHSMCNKQQGMDPGGIQ